MKCFFYKFFENKKQFIIKKSLNMPKYGKTQDMTKYELLGKNDRIALTNRAQVNAFFLKVN